MTWKEFAKEQPPEGAWCLVQQNNRDIVVAVRCSSWEGGFFTSRALKPKRAGGVCMRKVEKLTAPAYRWRLLGKLPKDGVPPLVHRVIEEGKARKPMTAPDYELVDPETLAHLEAGARIARGLLVKGLDRDLTPGECAWLEAERARKEVA